MFRNLTMSILKSTMGFFCSTPQFCIFLWQLFLKQTLGKHHGLGFNQMPIHNENHRMIFVGRGTFPTQSGANFKVFSFFETSSMQLVGSIRELKGMKGSQFITGG